MPQWGTLYQDEASDPQPAAGPAGYSRAGLFGACRSRSLSLASDLKVASPSFLPRGFALETPSLSAPCRVLANCPCVLLRIGIVRLVCHDLTSLNKATGQRRILFRYSAQQPVVEQSLFALVTSEYRASTTRVRETIEMDSYHAASAPDVIDCRTAAGQCETKKRAPPEESFKELFFPTLGKSICLASD